jgi:hypothetical protein
MERTGVRTLLLRRAPTPESLPAGDVVALRLVAGRLYAVARQDAGYRVSLVAGSGDAGGLSEQARRLSDTLGLRPSAADCWTAPTG